MPYPVNTSAGNPITIESEQIDGNENPKFAYDSRVITSESSGVTTTIYNVDQSIGNQFTFLNASRKASMGGIVQTATLICSVPVAGNYRLFLFDQSVTTSDHNSNGLSDTDLLKCVGFIDFNINQTTVNNFITSANGLGIIYQTTGSKNLYGVLVATSAVTLTGITATGINIRLGCSLD